MKLLHVHRRANDVLISIHTDESAWVVDPENPQLIAVQEDGVGTFHIVPDPRAVRDFTYGLNTEEDAPAEGDQIATAVRESALLVQEELARAAAPEDLTSHHQLPSL